MQEQVLKEELTPQNYQQRFLALINHERSAHIQELKRRYNAAMNTMSSPCLALVYSTGVMAITSL